MFDTKFDLTADPGRFLERSLNLWNSEGSLGELQNQAYGYLFPQGLFALLGEVAGAPAWVVQRAWSALLLVVAYEGTRRVYLSLARSGGIGVLDPWLAVVAGLAYASAPRLAGLVTRLSSEANPPALLPWALLALLLVREGRIRPRTGGLLAGFSVLCMGGVNAVAVVAGLPLVALALMTVPRGKPRRVTAGWLGASMAGAVAWWAIPLVLMSRFSPPFLDYIETSDATTSPTGWFNALRGADHWVAFVASGDKPWWPGAYELHTSPTVIVTSVVVALGGLIGLMLHSMPARRVLIISVLLGLCCLTLAHGSLAGSPLAPQFQQVLDGPLAMLRNVHKVDPLVRLPLSLGFAHLIGRIMLDWPASLGHRARLAPAFVALVAVAWPFALAPVRPPGWEGVPPKWPQIASTVMGDPDLPQPGTLILPSAGFGQQTWGWTVDEPIQPFARSPWIARSQIPLTPPQTIRFLDALVARAEDSAGNSTLADQLARAGIGWVLVRHDLDPAVSDPGLADAVSAGLQRSQGLTRDPVSDGMIEAFRVEGDVAVVSATAVSSVKVVSSGPEDVLSAVESGVVDRTVPTVVGEDAAALGLAAETAPAVVGDGYRRVERAFGLVRRATGPVLTPSEPYVQSRRERDYPGVGDAKRVAAEYAGLSGVVASTSGASPYNLGDVRAELGPQAAVDGDPQTFWASLPYSRPLNQWLELRLRHPQSLPVIEVVANANPLEALPIRQVAIVTDRERVLADVHPETGRAEVRLGRAAVSRVRIEITKTAGDPAQGSVGIREVVLGGVETTRSLVVPPVHASGDTTFVFRREGESRACTPTVPVVNCLYGNWRSASEAVGLIRDFTIDEPGVWTLTGRVRARSSPATAELLAPLGSKVRATSESVLRQDPAVAAAFAVDGSDDTYWLGSPRNPRPVLDLTWGQEREVSSISIIGPKIAASVPTRATLTAEGQSRRVSLVGGRATFEPIRTRSLLVEFDASDVMQGASPAPVGIAEVSIGGLEGLSHTIAPSEPTGTLCGFGPAAIIDGVGYETRVTGKLGDILTNGDLKLEVCGRSLDLVDGEHRLELRSTAVFEVVSASLRPRERTPEVEVRATTVQAWKPDHRVISVASGAASVLRIAQNVNAGWTAKLNGQELPAVRLDGWQQGFLVPEGAGGAVVLDFEPNGPYRQGLMLGGGLALLLVVGCTWSLIGEGRRRPLGLSGPDMSSHNAVKVLGTKTLGLIGAALVLLASPLTAIAFGLWCAGWHRTQMLWAAAGAVLTCALLVAPWVHSGGSAVQPPLLVDALVSVVVGLLAGSLMQPVVRREREGPHR